MANTARLYKIEALVRQRPGIAFTELMQALEVSRATLKRDLEYLRDQLGAPVVYDRLANGYRLGHDEPSRAATTRHELPGLWFNEGELYALLMAHQLLSGIDEQGLLGRHLQPMIDRIHDLLGPSGERDARTLVQRVKIMAAQRRAVPSEAFERVGRALVQRRRLQMRYLTRTRGEVSEREVSPQRLVHHRNTWYLDAFCHRREKLLRFALDAVQEAQVLDTRCKDIAPKQVQAEMDAVYGIYAGGVPKTALLKFSPQAAAWVQHERWHEHQQGQLLPDGSWELRLPYADETELVMDLLRQGEQVEVLAPPSLRQAVAQRLAAALRRYPREAIMSRAAAEAAPGD